MDGDAQPIVDGRQDVGSPMFVRFFTVAKRKKEREREIDERERKFGGREFSESFFLGFFFLARMNGYL